MMFDTQRKPSSYFTKRRFTSIALLGFLFWPTHLIAGGRAGGTTDSLRNKSQLSRWPGSKLILEQPWDIDPITLTPVCALDGHSLIEQCVDGLYNCGKLNVLCGDSIGGIEPLAAGTGLRNYRTGAIKLRAARDGSELLGALLLWGLIGSHDPAAPQGNEIQFADVELTGELLGTSDEPCWAPELPEPEEGDVVFKAYWADVTPYLNPEINGDYTVLLKGASLLGGEDPWGPTLPSGEGFEAEGATLIAMVKHPEISLDSMFALHAGPSLLLGHEEYHHELPLPVPSADRVRHIRIGADGQTRTELNPVTSFNTLFSPFEDHWISLRGEESSIDLHHDWQGTDGGPVLQLWDTQITTTASYRLDLLPGLESYRLRYETNEAPVPEGPDFVYDCVEVVAHGLWVGE